MLCGPQIMTEPHSSAGGVPLRKPCTPILRCCTQQHQKIYHKLRKHTFFVCDQGWDAFHFHGLLLICSFFGILPLSLSYAGHLGNCIWFGFNWSGQYHRAHAMKKGQIGSNWIALVQPKFPSIRNASVKWIWLWVNRFDKIIQLNSGNNNIALLI